ncbi:uncharacterized protein [Cherax quadricarinatus]|uniref:uncharacterized protein n=1 Tax=Cherax quadricarinatus TaxID=27406 RepID=UPI00387EA99D
MCEAYKAFFVMPVVDQDKTWAPHVAGEHCKKTLEGCYRGEKKAMKFTVPRIWREPTDHSTNCCFCLVDPSKHRIGKKCTCYFLLRPSLSIAPVPHSADLPVPTPPARSQPSEESSKSENEEHSGQDYDLTDAAVGRNPYYPNQTDLNDLIRDLGLTKSNAELFISRLKEWDLVDESVQVTCQRNRH